MDVKDDDDDADYDDDENDDKLSYDRGVSIIYWNSVYHIKEVCW